MGNEVTHERKFVSLTYISAKHIWDQLRACWIDTYLGPPDFISADAGKQLMAREFKQYAVNMRILVKNAPVVLREMLT